MNSYTEENYLKALIKLSQVKPEVSVHEISKSLGIKMPTVNSMMKKLAEKRLIYYESYKPVQLTDKGKKEAGLILRKHRLTEMFLVQKMGIGWEEVHAIAEQIEHIQSPVFFEKMDILLNFPRIDPHGSPIPDRNGDMKYIPYEKLSNYKAGDRVKLAAVQDSSDEFLIYLNKRNLNLGLVLEIKSVEEFDGSMVISYPVGNEEVLSRFVCEKLFVENV
jgi:DtxR family Mn-dependent transcriptional regulator